MIVLVGRLGYNLLMASSILEMIQLDSFLSFQVGY